MIATCTDVVSRAYEQQGEVDELLDEVERDILRISGERVSAESPDIKNLVHRAIHIIEDYHQRQGKLGGLATGFIDLDKMTDGLHAGEMIIIAARPSMGKTSLAMNVVEHVVTQVRLPVGVFSLEMTAESLVMRMMSSLARVNARNIRDGFLSERDFARLTTAAGNWPKRRCSSTIPAGSPSCNCGRKRGGWRNSTASSFSSLTTSSCSILLRAEPKTVSKKLRTSPTA
jgi:replicative DNA helicase